MGERLRGPYCNPSRNDKWTWDSKTGSWWYGPGREDSLGLLEKREITDKNWHRWAKQLEKLRIAPWQK